MATMNVSLPDELKEFVDSRVSEDHYSSSSEYIRELLRAEWAKQRLRRELVTGFSSENWTTWDQGEHDRLRAHIESRAAESDPE
ncbi:ribbon-helix-helix domain-containing protein [Nesterenkonia ebinurensis]|uniref:ribbon-helix-helix domain-containing protein n=1 Tax=Nesterenkonia ebinurensis TaxID=2608252 RepID=UPI00168B18C1|nr:type II toxin-antitoxin system ParD family antitoxin [Nesterenkonia ebinurensis]